VNLQCEAARQSIAFRSDIATLASRIPHRGIIVTLKSGATPMKQTLLQEKYPVYTLELLKSETSMKDADAIIDYLRNCIEGHKIAKLISTFDHYAHTQALEEGEIADDILAAKHVVFCFGTHLKDAHVMAVRPRSIGVVEKPDRFVVTFLEAPMPLANSAMEGWVKALARSPESVPT
jgi:hypothetical protein